MDIFGDDRDALNDYAKYYNNSHLSDVTLIVGEESFPAHRLVLCHSSDVFDRLFSHKWNGDKKELELTEDPQCREVFGPFLRFLYCNHVQLHPDNVLPILILADKYGVHGLKKVCIQYAIDYILPELPHKELFHVWFSYATKAYHVPLINVCVEILASQFYALISSEEWEKDWLSVDRDQLIELLKSNDLVVPNEYVLWEAVQRWLQAPAHPERRGNTSSPLLVQVLPLIRFPFMSADELAEVESSSFAQHHPKLFMPYTHLAFKFISMPLSSRAKCKDFVTTQFLLRKYTDTRWDERIVIHNERLYRRHEEHIFPVETRSSSLALQSWHWTLNFQVMQTTYTPPAEEQLKITLTGVDVDHTNRSVEYLLMICSDKKVLRTIFGTKTFTKTRYQADMELDNVLTANDIFAENSQLLTSGNLNLQIIIRPIV